MDQLKQKIKNLKENLPTHIPINISPNIDVVRAADLRECLYHRLVELTDSVYEECQQGRLIAAIILQRAYMETQALFNALITKLEQALSSNNFDELQKFLTKALRGARSKIATEQFNRPESINILTCIENMNKKIPNYSDHYEHLCEFSHPNSAGVNRSYSNIDWDNGKIDFKLRNDRIDVQQITTWLDVSIDFFSFEYNRTASLLEQWMSLPMVQNQAEGLK